ncbi:MULTISPECIES: hypothetical protein [Tolypothrix]
MEIFQTLAHLLKLEFLEIAIGSICPVDFHYLSVPLILHNSCLYKEGMRLRLEILNPRTWQPYSEFIANSDVRAVSIHPTLQRDCTKQELEKALFKLQKTLNVPVYLEVMPSSEYWCSSLPTLVEYPLLLDVSHVLIWFQGNQSLTKETCLEILNSYEVGEIHLSHNNGFSDAHDLIPSKVWFHNLIEPWSQKYFVTYESLPQVFYLYERLDKQKTGKNKKIREII